jgi:hypothetical protein
MDSFRVKRVLVGLGVIVLIIVSITAVVNLAKNLTSDDETSEAQLALVLSDYDDNSSYVRLTYDGAVVGKDEHRAIRITVSASERKIEILTDYNGSVLSKKTYQNNPAAYAVFLRALEIEGFMDDRKSEFDDDERGVCATGTRTIAELYNSNQEISRLWAASCSNKLGTLAGDSKAILALFQKQITDYREITKNVKLR